MEARNRGADGGVADGVATGAAAGAGVGAANAGREASDSEMYGSGSSPESRSGINSGEYGDYPQYGGEEPPLPPNMPEEGYRETSWNEEEMMDDPWAEQPSNDEGLFGGGGGDGGGDWGDWGDWS